MTSRYDFPEPVISGVALIAGYESLGATVKMVGPGSGVVTKLADGPATDDSHQIGDVLYELAYNAGGTLLYGCPNRKGLSTWFASDVVLDNCGVLSHTDPAKWRRSEQEIRAGHRAIEHDLVLFGKDVMIFWYGAAGEVMARMSLADIYDKLQRAPRYGGLA